MNCEEQSYGFQELSYIEFPPLDPHYNLISLEFATIQQNSLLLYNHGDPSTSEFLALETVDGRLWFSYDLGSGVVRLVTGKSVTDGSFHNITVNRTGNVRHFYFLDIVLVKELSDILQVCIPLCLLDSFCRNRYLLYQ